MKFLASTAVQLGSPLFCDATRRNSTEARTTASFTHSGSALGTTQSSSGQRATCAVAGHWRKVTGQSRGLRLIRLNQSRMVETMALEWVITKGWNPKHRDCSELFICGCSYTRCCPIYWKCYSILNISVSVSSYTHLQIRYVIITLSHGHANYWGG